MTWIQESSSAEGCVLELSLFKVVIKVMGEMRLAPKGDNIERNIRFKG